MTTKTKNPPAAPTPTPEEEIALAVADNDAALAEAMKKVMEEKGISLTDLVAAFGDLKVVASEGIARAGTRKAKRLALAAPAVDLSEDDREALEDALKVIEADLPLPNDDGVYSQTQIDDLCRRLKTIRRLLDVFNGRHDGVKSLVFDVIDAVYGPNEPGELASAAEGYKLERAVVPGRPRLDEAALLDKVGKRMFNQVTVEVREVDEDRILQARMDGAIDDATWELITSSRRELDEDRVAELVMKKKIAPRDLYDAVIVPAPTLKFTPKPLKPNEVVAI